jgi:hypothetical protein
VALPTSPVGDAFEVALDAVDNERVWNRNRQILIADLSGVSASAPAARIQSSPKREVVAAA